MCVRIQKMDEDAFHLVPVGICDAQLTAHTAHTPWHAAAIAGCTGGGGRGLKLSVQGRPWRSAERGQGWG